MIRPEPGGGGGVSLCAALSLFFLAMLAGETEALVLAGQKQQGIANRLESCLCLYSKSQRATSSKLETSFMVRVGSAPTGAAGVAGAKSGPSSLHLFHVKDDGYIAWPFHKTSKSTRITDSRPYPIIKITELPWHP